MTDRTEDDEEEGQGEEVLIPVAGVPRDSRRIPPPMPEPRFEPQWANREPALERFLNGLYRRGFL